MLLQGDAGVGGAAEPGNLRGNADVAGAEDSLQPAPHLLVQGLGKQRAGPEIRYCAGGGGTAGWRIGASSHQKRQDFAGGQGRIGTVGDSKTIQGPDEIQTNVILIHPGPNVKVKSGLDSKRVGEGQLASIRQIMSPGNGDFTL